MNKYKEYFVSQDDSNIRIDRWLRRKFKKIPQSFFENRLRKGIIKLNHKKIKANKIVIKPDVIQIYDFDEKVYSLIDDVVKYEIGTNEIKKLKLAIIYENEDFFILNKWIGIATQGGTNVIKSIDQIIKSISHRYNLVHRLDKETSGLLILSKNYQTSRFFGKLFKEKKIKKVYLALCKGRIKNKKNSVEINIKKISGNKNNKITNSNDGQKSITTYEVIEYKSGVSVVIFMPLTGRMHQIRMVAKYLNTPILGDKKYNNSKDNLSNDLMLHALSVSFEYKKTKREFFAQIPEHMKKNFKKLGLKIPKINN